MKKHAILMQCHTAPEQINLMTALFPADQFDFYIHVDRKSDIQPKIEARENVRFVPDGLRVDVRWGRFSQVEATLALLRMVDPERCAYAHLISGCDFPIKRPEAIVRACDGREFIQSKILPGDTVWAWGGLDRFMVRYPDWMIRRPDHRAVRAIRLAYREIAMRTGLYRLRKTPTDAFYRGSSWFSITGECAAWMLEYIDAHPEYTRFFRHGVCVDEIYFSTLIRLSPFAGRIDGDPMRYIRWKGGRNGGPAFLTEADIPAMAESPGFFARKIDGIGLCRKIQSALLKG